jgi:hypothetical protein
MDFGDGEGVGDLWSFWVFIRSRAFWRGAKEMITRI